LNLYAQGFDWRPIAARVVEVYREAISAGSRAATHDRSRRTQV
jgi:hypothetical protein